MNRLRWVVLGLCLLSPLAATALEPRSGLTWSTSVDFTVGYFTEGVSLVCTAQTPAGWTFGVSARLLLPSAYDDVNGLEAHQVFFALLPVVGWSTGADSSWQWSAGVQCGPELTWLEEKIVDPAHGLDLSYSNLEVLADYGAWTRVAWFGWGAVGVDASLWISVFDLHKTVLTAGMIGRF